MARSGDPPKLGLVKGPTTDSENVSPEEVMGYCAGRLIAEERVLGAAITAGTLNPTVGNAKRRALNLGITNLQTAMLWIKEARSYDGP